MYKCIELECKEMKKKLILSMKNYNAKTSLRKRVKNYLFDLVESGKYDNEFSELKFMSDYYVNQKMSFYAFGPIIDRVSKKDEKLVQKLFNDALETSTLEENNKNERIFN